MSREQWLRALPQADRRAGRARRRRRPAGLHPGDARRGAARPRDAAGHRADGVHDGQPDEAGERPSSATRAWPASRARDFRWERGDIKSISLLGNVLARQISADRGAARDDHVPRRLPDRGGGVATSGSCTRARCSARRRASTCSKASATSCSRSCARTCGIAYNLRPISEAEVLAADEMLLSSATKEVLPVTTLDGEPVGHGALRGKPGPVYARLYEAYQRAKRRSRSERGSSACIRRARTTLDHDDSAKKSLIEYPSRVPDQGDGRERRRLRARRDRRSRGASTRPSTPPPIELRPSSRPASTWA